MQPRDLQRADHPLDVEEITPIGPITVRRRVTPEDVLAADALAAARLDPDVPDTKLSRPDRTSTKRRKLQCARAVLLMAEGLSPRDVADTLGLAVTTITGYLTSFRRSVEAGNIDQALDEIAVPLAKNNLIHGLLAGDKQYTLETLKGRGKLRRYSQADEHVSHELPDLVVRFEGGPAPAPGTGVPPHDVVEGQILGRVLLPKHEDPA